MIAAAHRVDQFNGYRALPCYAVITWIDIDTGCRAEEIGEVCHNRKRGDGIRHAITQAEPIVRHNVGAHAVFHFVIIDG